MQTKKRRYKVYAEWGSFQDEIHVTAANEMEAELKARKKGATDIFKIVKA